MKLNEYSHASDFLDKTLPFLEKNESANNLMIGLAFRLINQPEIYTMPPYLATVEEDNEPLLAALMTPPHHIILAAFQPKIDAAISSLCDALQKKNWHVPGVRAPSETAAAFADKWARQFRVDIETGQSLRVYELQKVIQPPTTSGVMRLADMDDLELAAKWMDEFNREALNENDPARARQSVEFRIRYKELYFWEDSHPISMAAATRPTRHGIVIGGVYTPPTFRKHGYASILVATLSQLMLDQGYQFVSLFTNLANPTSNKIYQDIGYLPICDFQEYHFSKHD